MNNLATALSHLARMDEATEMVQQALLLQPNYVDANFNLSQLRLLEGNFAQGWTDYEWRWQLKDFGRRGFREPEWDGSSLEGKTILVHAEQGLGDTLQFVRLLPLVKQRGGTVLFECQKVLAPLLERCAGFDRLIAQGSGIPPFDVQISLLSVPRLLGITLENLPAEVPYIEADELLAEYWQRELGNEETFNVGIVWQGNPFPPVDRFRSIALQEYAPLARVPGVRLFSLQKGAGSEQLHSLTEPFPVIDLGRRLDLGAGAFLDTAAAMTQLDLVISSDTAAVHLAGALGVPVWMPLSSAADWRWLLHREDSPWYPSMRLFRQSQLGRWGEVFQRMAGELQRLASESPHRVGFRAPRKSRSQSPLRCRSRKLRMRIISSGRLNCIAPETRRARTKLTNRCWPSNLVRLRAGICTRRCRIRRAGLSRRSIACIGPLPLIRRMPTIIAIWGRPVPSWAIAKRRSSAFRKLAAQPGRIDVLVNLGTAQRKAGQIAAAETTFRQALQVDPIIPKRGGGYSNCSHKPAKIASAREDWGQAVEHLQEAVRLEPGNAMAYGDLGVALYGRNLQVGRGPGRVSRVGAFESQRCRQPTQLGSRRSPTCAGWTNRRPICARRCDSRPIMPTPIGIWPSPCCCKGI